MDDATSVQLLDGENLNDFKKVNACCTSKRRGTYYLRGIEAGLLDSDLQRWSGTEIVRKVSALAVFLYMSATRRVNFSFGKWEADK